MRAASRKEYCSLKRTGRTQQMGLSGVSRAKDICDEMRPAKEEGISYGGTGTGPHGPDALPH